VPNDQSREQKREELFDFPLSVKPFLCSGVAGDDPTTATNLLWLSLDPSLL
jgi:hypothetical protein